MIGLDQGRLSDQRIVEFNRAESQDLIIFGLALENWMQPLWFKSQRKNCGLVTDWQRNLGSLENDLVGSSTVEEKIKGKIKMLRKKEGLKEKGKEKKIRSFKVGAEK